MRKISLCFLTVLFSFPLVIMAEQSFFIKNEGQLINEQGKKIEEVLFVYKGKEYDVYFQNDKISYILKKVENPPRRKTGLSYLESDYTIQSYRVDLEFLYSEKPKIEFEKSPENIEYFSNVLDEELKALNSDYEAKRVNNLVLDQPEINKLASGTFYQWMKVNNKLGGQHKIPRLSNDSKYVEELLSLVQF